MPQNGFSNETPENRTTRSCAKLADGASAPVALPCAACVGRSLRIGVIGADPPALAALAGPVNGGTRCWTWELFVGNVSPPEKTLIPPPDVLLVNAKPPVRRAVTYIRQVRAALPALPIILLLPSPAADKVMLAALHFRLCGCLVHPILPEPLATAIQNLLQVGVSLCPPAQLALLTQVQRLAPVSRPIAPRPENHTLSSREMQVMECLKNNLSDKQISVRLGIAEGTVHRHITNIFRKYHVNRRSAALRIFLSPP